MVTPESVVKLKVKRYLRLTNLISSCQQQAATGEAVCLILLGVTVDIFCGRVQSGAW